MQNDQLQSLQLEKHLIGGLIKHPNTFFDVDAIISEQVFWSDVHHIIYSVIKPFVVKGNSLDPILIGSHIKDLGITFIDENNIIHYVHPLP